MDAFTRTGILKVDEKSGELTVTPSFRAVTNVYPLIEGIATYK